MTVNGEPQFLVAFESAWVNHSTLVAWWLTWMCFVYVLVPLCIVLGILACLLPAWRSRLVLSIVSVLLCWQAADLAQRFFARPRRLDWVVRHEHAYSYPSSHAAISVGFYLLWALMLASPELPRPVRLVAPALLTVLALAICWSRLALGAHYATDLIGGGLLAVAVVAAELAVVPIKLLAGPAGRS